MRKSKTIGCGVLALVLLGVAQTVGAVDPSKSFKSTIITDSSGQYQRAKAVGLPAPVLPAQAKAVTRFSKGAANLRQQVQLQTGASKE